MVSRTVLAKAITAVMSAGFMASAVAAQARSYHFDIKSEPLSQALRDYGQISGREIVFTDDLLVGSKPASLKGDYTAEAAITRLLNGTGLTAEYSPSGALMIRKPLTQAAADRTSYNDGARTQSSGQFAQVNPSSLLSAPSPSPSPASGDGAQRTDDGRTTIDEIIVTAQKRSERLQDVPIPVSVVQAGSIAESNQPRLQDFYSSVPGLSVSPPVGGSTEQNIAIRGITTGAGSSPTVAVSIDDIPFGASTGLSGDIVPDIDPADLARIEVLRGPQGALYGASGLGGLIKYVTLEPSTDKVTGHVQVDVNTIRNGSNPGYGFRGGINLPISDALAVRASAFTRQTPGYIDNPVLGIRGVNQEQVSGGHFSTLWRFSDSLSLKLSALFQHDKADGASEVFLPTAGFLPQTAGFGDLQQNYPRGIGGFDVKIQAYSAVLNSKFDNVSLTSVTGYNITHSLSSLDYSFALGGVAGLFGVSSSPYFNDAKIRSFTEELRAIFPTGPKLDWLIGAFFAHQATDAGFQILAENPTTGALPGNIFSAFSLGDGGAYQEMAGYMDLTVHFTDRLDVQIGGRQSHMLFVHEGSYETGALIPNGLVAIPGVSSTTLDAFTYLLTPQFKISPDLMTYIRLASGYRPGDGFTRPSPEQPCVIYHFPCGNTSDKTKNYEIGVKGAAFDHLLSFDASLYYIDWKNIQFRGVNQASSLGYDTNGGGAKSEGVELSLESHPLDGLSLSFWTAYNDAALTKSFPAHSTYVAEPGDRLPFSSRFSGNVSLNQDVVVSQDITAFGGITLAYQGGSVGNFVGANADRQLYSSVTRTDIKAGLHYRDYLKAILYANNLADKRTVIGGGGAYNFPPYAYAILQPRTVGLTLVYSFN